MAADAGHRRAGANQAADRVVGAGEEDDVVHASRGADPRFGDGGGRSRRHDAVLRESPAESRRERRDHSGDRRRIGRRRHDAELARIASGRHDAGSGALRRRREIAVGRNDSPRLHAAAIVDPHRDRARVLELEA